MENQNYYMMHADDMVCIVKKSRISYLCEEVVFRGTEIEAMKEWKKLNRKTLKIGKIRFA